VIFPFQSCHSGTQSDHKHYLSIFNCCSKWIHDRLMTYILIKNLHIDGLEKSSLSNLYMLEQQLLILKQSSIPRMSQERAIILA
jgi:hypothetical protein